MLEIDVSELPFTIVFLMGRGKDNLALDLERFICTITTRGTGVFMQFVQV